MTVHRTTIGDVSKCHIVVYRWNILCIRLICIGIIASMPLYIIYYIYSYRVNNAGTGARRILRVNFIFKWDNNVKQFCESLPGKMLITSFTRNVLVRIIFWENYLYRKYVFIGSSFADSCRRSNHTDVYIYIYIYYTGWVGAYMYVFITNENYNGAVMLNM